MSLVINRTNWWERHEYHIDALLPEELQDPDLWGPKGPAFVRAYADGSTQQGWGGTDFMPRYTRGEFLSRRTEYGYNLGKHAAALVTRSFRGFVVDIDGKNGGLQFAGSLGALPLTLAETSKSGNGYHLYYLTDELWDEETGFSLIPDHIGIVQGVDIRGSGCVYHHDTQRWNGFNPVQAPQWLVDRLLQRKQQREHSAATIQKTLNSLDETEILIMHSNLLDELAKPIPAGKRNTTLFAIGSQLKQAEVPDWGQAVSDRAIALGLPTTEAEKIVSNIENYGG